MVDYRPNKIRSTCRGTVDPRQPLCRRLLTLVLCCQWCRLRCIFFSRVASRFFLCICASVFLIIIMMFLHFPAFV